MSYLNLNIELSDGEYILDHCKIVVKDGYIISMDDGCWTKVVKA